MHITNFSPPKIPTIKTIPTTKDKNAQIVAERMDKKSTENGITSPSIQNISYTVLFKGLSIIYFNINVIELSIVSALTY